MTKAADIVGPITLTVLVNDLLFLVVLSGFGWEYVWSNSLLIRRHRWPTGISSRWLRWPSRWWRRAGTLLALSGSDTKGSSTATRSQRAWSSGTGAPTGPSESELGTRTSPLWVVYMWLIVSYSKLLTVILLFHMLKQLKMSFSVSLCCFQTRQP